MTDLTLFATQTSAKPNTAGVVAGNGTESPAAPDGLAAVVAEAANGSGSASVVGV